MDRPTGVAGTTGGLDPLEVRALDMLLRCVAACHGIRFEVRVAVCGGVGCASGLAEMQLMAFVE